MTYNTSKTRQSKDWHTQIGFSQRVRLEWLELAADLVLAGNDAAAVTAALQLALQDKVSIGGSAGGCNRDKVVSILRQVWVAPRPGLEKLRDAGLAFLSSQDSNTSPRNLNLAVHWGMVMATYPFWASVATQTGRLLRLQGNAVSAQIQLRVREQYGERATVARAGRRVLRSFHDWGVLRETGSRGIYTAGAPLAIHDPRLIAWLCESALHVRANGAAPLREVLNSPVFFPFQIKAQNAESVKSASARLDILRHGLDDDLVRLR